MGDMEWEVLDGRREEGRGLVFRKVSLAVAVWKIGEKVSDAVTETTVEKKLARK